MPPIEVPISSFAAVLRRRFEEDAARLRRAAHEVTLRGVADAVALTDAAGAIDSGEYRAGWRAVLTRDGAQLVNDAPHAAAVEYGRRPGRPPPLRPLQLWAMRRLGLPPAEAARVAAVVSRKIGREGVRPRFVARAVRARLGAAFRVAALRALRR